MSLQDIDRWILSDLQLLVKAAHEAFRGYNVMAFCQKAEEFIDDKLSNWYVRRNRRRFWKSEKGADKTAAYQTLYTVLTTLTKLIAPIVPFVAEAMWQNLKTVGSEESVHHADYPQPDETLIDAQLTQDMDALLRLVSLSRAVRESKSKVRQPLAELRIQPGSDADRRAVERFADQIADELNLKRVTLHDAAKGPLLTFEVKANPKNLGPKFGNRMKAVQAALAALAPATVAEQVQAGKPIELQCSDGPATLEPSDVWVLPKVAEGFAGLVERGTQLLLDARITPELAREGMAREVIRHVQNSRKDANLQMEDRIALHLYTEDAELTQAIAAHRDYIAGETLVAGWSDKPLGEGAYCADVEVDKKKLRIELRNWSG